ncbi:thiaminase II [Peribacillus sp. SCS-37]|uniref:thiaminase II n=1 Tax=Paraperibacillus esterisolvens TaxID=3115296 RepID=UPI003906AA44
MKFTRKLYEKLKPIWRENHKHPFVVEMGAGILDPEKFRFYMIQDYLYLMQYTKLFALGVVKAESLEDMRLFSLLLHSTIHDEMELHRMYAQRFGITAEELERAESSPVTLAYTHYMLYSAGNGTLADLTAALLPCMWSYWEIGKELSSIPGACDHELYGGWIKAYSSGEFGSLAERCIGLMDRLAEEKADADLMRLETIFLNTTRFEYLFWDMAYNKEMWPGNV